MSKERENIDSELSAWIARQRVFFVGTAPLSRNGHVNISPKGGEAFCVLGPLEVAYQDFPGAARRPGPLGCQSRPGKARSLLAQQEPEEHRRSPGTVLKIPSPRLTVPLIHAQLTRQT